MIKSNNIFKIKQNTFNAEIVAKYLITGLENKIKLDIEEITSQEIHEKENQFGIITYEEKFKYGNKGKIPKNFNEITEPLRILIDENIFNEYTNHIKKLIVLNTNKTCYENISFQDLINDFEYKILFANYGNGDLQNRYLPLPGKYNDARTIHQMIEKNQLVIENIEQNKKNLYNWFVDNNKIREKIELDIKKTLNKLFKNNEEYYFQKNHPLRFSVNNSIGTPMHIDSSCKVYDKSKNRICENINNKIKDDIEYYETFQNENIFNINYIINNDKTNYNQLRISTINYNDIGKKEGYFFKILLNYSNECFIFNASKFLHYKSFNHMNCYIRGDIRIIRKKDYDFEKFKLYRGPRMNFNVSFCINTDIEKLNDNNVKYSVFKN